MKLSSNTKGILPVAALGYLLFSVTACLKLEMSPAQDLGPILVATQGQGPALADTTPKYRYSNVSSGSTQTMALYSGTGCTVLLSGTAQSVNLNQVTSYFQIQPGTYSFGPTAYVPSVCISFSPVSGGSYTLIDNAYYTLSIVSP